MDIPYPLLTEQLSSSYFAAHLSRESKQHKKHDVMMDKGCTSKVHMFLHFGPLRSSPWEGNCNLGILLKPHTTTGLVSKDIQEHETAVCTPSACITHQERHGFVLDWIMAFRVNCSGIGIKFVLTMRHSIQSTADVEIGSRKVGIRVSLKKGVFALLRSKRCCCIYLHSAMTAEGLALTSLYHSHRMTLSDTGVC